MQSLGSCSKLYRVFSSASSSTTPLRTLASLTLSSLSPTKINTLLSRYSLASPWPLIPLRGMKVHGSDVRPGNIIERKGRIFEVIKADHTQQGRGGALIQVELRDVDSGNKINERFRTDETLDKVFVEAKQFTCFYRDGDNVVLMDTNTFEQMEVHKDLFGKAAAYLKEEMKGIVVQMFNGKPLSASVPKQVTCTVKEAQPYVKGNSVNHRYKKVLLDNGLTVLVPTHIVAGDNIIISTTDDSYITRA